MSDDPAAAFLVEAGDVLDGVESALLDLNDRLDDMAVINAVFRGLHTIKGSGAMFGFDALADFTHHCETAFDKVRKGEVPATARLVSVILAACDHMRSLLLGSAGDETGNGAGAAILAQLGEEMALTPARPGGERDCDPAPPAPDAATGWHLRFRLAPDAMARGINPLALLAELADLGPCRVIALDDAIPALPELDPTHCHIGWEVTLSGAVTKAAIEDVFLFVLDDMDLDLTPLAATGPAQPDATRPETARPETAADHEGQPHPVPSRTAPAETVRVPADRLDAVMNRVGELVIAQSRLSQIAGGSDNIALRSVSEEIERLSGELRTTMMVLRMVPVAQLFGRFRRLVHDLAAETGKDINLEIEGEGTEVDKTVVERLFDPIVHLVRNSCDHGLEDADERVAAGKPPAGTVRLSACQSGGQVVITITDDGRGIAVERVRARAEANGLIEPGDQISEHDLIQFIFHPGFSTAAKVTSLSGRGVGMDVVKRTIEGLRGTIDIASHPGQGSTISLRIPLTLAIIEGLLVRVGTGRYVLPLAAVEECLELTAAEDTRSQGRSLITLRERLVPFVRLREVFAAGVPPDPFQKIVVVASGATRAGLVVDQIIGSHQTVIKSMSPLQKGAAAFAGATILGDGTVALILDIGHLLALTGGREERLRAVG
jgi:two-component system chemotaxis sensor kinase CheA